ncbi:hypothetical protein COB72_09955 [bacterium]|nr:MAG: hypothetical protein COB72_09955 [bacterium]
MKKQAIISGLQNSKAAFIEHSKCVELSNTNESIFRSFFIEQLCKEDHSVRCQVEWNFVDVFVKFPDRNVLIEFKYYLHRRSMKLDGSIGNRKGGASTKNKSEFDKCVRQLFDDSRDTQRAYKDASAVVHEKYLILAYERKVPSPYRFMCYSTLYDSLEPGEFIESVDWLPIDQDDELRIVLLTIK